MKIFLADLQNSYYRYLRNSVPIGMGYVAAYLQKEFGGRIEIRQFRKFEEIHAAAAETTPDVVAFGSYSWNSQLTQRTAAWVRQRFPDAVIAIGGPDVSQVPGITFDELRRLPAVDFMMPNEGEQPLANLVAARFEADRDQLRRRAVAGCLSLDAATGEPLGSVLSRFEGDINDIPSPYLGGLMDRFLADPDYLPIIQTARGCPYRCTFCVSGKETWTKVKMFDIDRVKAEIDYVAARAANRYMRLADENFGILPRDIGIAEYLMAKREATGFPTAVSIYTDKHPTERVKQINLMMRELMPFCISFQSATDQVLTNINRINIKGPQVDEAVSFARDHGLLLVSELIFALPGESRASFFSSIDQLLDLRFESIALNQLRILKGTVMDQPEDREKFQVKTMFSMSENGYTAHPEMENVEIDEWVVENSSLSLEEYFNTNKFIFAFDFAHYRSYLKELLFFFENFGLRASRLLSEAVLSTEHCPLLSTAGDAFVAGMKRMLHPTPEAVVEHVRQAMRTDPSSLEGIYRLEDRLMIDFFEFGRFPAVVAELAGLGRRLVAETRGGALPAGFDDALDAIVRLTVACFIPLDVPGPQETTLIAGFDIAAWVAERYARPLTDHALPAPAATVLRIRVMANYEDLWTSEFNLRDRYKRQFATTNSSNRRRFVERTEAQSARIA